MYTVQAAVSEQAAQIRALEWMDTQDAFGKLDEANDSLIICIIFRFQPDYDDSFEKNS